MLILTSQSPQSGSFPVPLGSVSFVAAAHCCSVWAGVSKDPGSPSLPRRHTLHSLPVHFLLKAIFVFLLPHHWLSFKLLSKYHPGAPHALPFGQVSSAQQCCSVPSLIEHMAHWDQCKYFPWLQRTLDKPAITQFIGQRGASAAHLQSVMALTLPEACPKSMAFPSPCGTPSRRVLLPCHNPVGGADPASTMRYSQSNEPVACPVRRGAGWHCVQLKAGLRGGGGESCFPSENAHLR